MKNLSLITSLLLLCCCCSVEPQVYDTEVGSTESTSDHRISIITVDQHEYILFEAGHNSSANAGGICHSESCPNDVHISRGF
jgi:hypothetical protein